MNTGTELWLFAVSLGASALGGMLSARRTRWIRTTGAPCGNASWRATTWLAATTC